MKKKLIEVALPLDAINAAASREKSIRHGHPSTIHLWWARRPLAACRAVIFAQLVDDPSARPEEFPTLQDQLIERQRLFRIIERLVVWENSTDEEVLAAARAEIERCYPQGAPPVHDPFAGGGSIPLEAQRLGLSSFASDLNPVAVLINTALLALPQRWAGRPPVHAVDDATLIPATWRLGEGLAADVSHYGRRLLELARERLQLDYPVPRLPDGSSAEAIAWIWARTVTCSNPACTATTPLVRSFWLRKKRGRERWVRPVVDGRHVRFELSSDPSGPAIDGTVTSKGARCLVCASPISFSHIRGEGRAHQLGQEMMAAVVQGNRERIYLTPSDEQLQAANRSRPPDAPDTELPAKALGFRVQAYGMVRHADLFTNRQLAALLAISDLVADVRSICLTDAVASGMGEPGASDYASAIALYLALAIDRVAMTGSSLVRWNPVGEKAQHMFGRQAVSMLWDFAEPAVLGNATGGLEAAISYVADPLSHLGFGSQPKVWQESATTSVAHDGVVICTDPPYYDNVGYSDLADFFYVWLRRSLREFFPEILATVLSPKLEELIADPARFDDDRDRARAFFENGFMDVFARSHMGYPVDTPMSLFYAFKQAEDDVDVGSASTGWETLLEGLVKAGWIVTATWPIRTEMATRLRGMESNALASSIVLTCRPRANSASVTDRRDFISKLKAELPDALRSLQNSSIAPVDLAQAAIGPGMSVFTRHARILESDGSSMRVRTALGLINQVLAEVLDEQQGDFDPDTRWALKWFEQSGFDEGGSGVAEQLCTTYNVSLRGLDQAGIIALSRGRTRLLDLPDLADDWDPSTASTVSIWTATNHLARRLDRKGESAAAELLRRLGGLGGACRELAYLLFAICERTKRSKAAQPYNALVASWPELSRLAASEVQETQGTLL